MWRNVLNIAEHKSSQWKFQGSRADKKTGARFTKLLRQLFKIFVILVLKDIIKVITLKIKNKPIFNE